MDLKKKLKNFFTFDRRASDGFTLVELIVVIAILAILGGVAVPAYNGYINKANKAADETLIAAINKAAAAAVLEANGKDMKDLTTGKLLSNATKGMPQITVWDKNASNEALQHAFDKYFADNADAALKWYGSIQFENKDGNGRFKGVEPLLKGGLTSANNPNVAEAFKGSSYNILGVTGMTEMVDTLAGALADYPALNLVTETSAFQATLEKLGIDPDTADSQTLANAAVFYLADYTSQMNEAEIWQHLKDGDLEEWLTGDPYGLKMNQNDAKFFETAFRYAAATSFAYSGDGSEGLKDILASADPSDRNEALAIITQLTTGDNEDAWDAYLNAGVAGSTDFHAFYEVMGVVKENGGNFNSFGNESMFSNAELQAAINQLLGINS